MLRGSEPDAEVCDTVRLGGCSIRQPVRQDVNTDKILSNGCRGFCIVESEARRTSECPFPAPNRAIDHAHECPMVGVDRKTIAQFETYRFWTQAV